MQMTGAVVSSLLFESAGCGKSEGLLFGRRAVRTASGLTDDTTAAQTATSSSRVAETVTSVVSSAVRTGESGSFYSATGGVDMEMVARVEAARVADTPGLVLLGWWSARNGLPLTPTLRERAVTAGLGSRVGEGCVLVLLSTSVEENIHSVGYAAWTGSPLALVVPVVTNLVGSSNAEYAALDAVSLLPEDAIVQAALPAVIDPLPAAVAASESLFRSVLRHVASLSDDLVSTHADIARLKADIAQLEASSSSSSS